jgi:hypothetical protein
LDEKDLLYMGNRQIYIILTVLKKGIDISIFFTSMKNIVAWDINTELSVPNLFSHVT